MRILSVTPTFFPIVGGAELLIRDVLNLWSQDHEVRLLTPYLEASSEAFWVDDDAEESCRFEIRRFHDRLNLLGVPGKRLSRGLVPPMSLTAVRELRRQVDELKPDLLVGFFGIPYGLPLAIVSKQTGVPFMLVMCGTDLPSPRTRYVPLWGDYLRAVVDRASKVVYVSRFCFDILNRRSFKPSHDHVIFGGIDLLAPRYGDPAAVRRELGLATDDIMLFALQRLGPEKRVDVLLRAFAALPKLSRRVKLVVGGQGSEASALRRLAEELGIERDVCFTGHLGPEKDAYYQASDIFVFHSLFETFGQVLVEAMRAGKPIVTARVGATPEVVEEGVTALVAEPEDEVGMAGCIERLVRDESLRVRMGAAGRERAERLFDWRSVGSQWLELLSPSLPALPTEKQVEPQGAGLGAGS